LILNNLELDHTDVFGDIESLLVSFHEMVGKVKEGGIIVANTSDSKITSILETEMPTLLARNVRVVRLGEGEDAWKLESKQVDLKREVTLSKDQITYRFNLAIPGHFNAMNAAAAALMTQGLGGKYEAIAASIQEFKGIWRRFEFLGEKNGALVYSDYGHHPTAVEATLKAARESFQDKRLVLCFQPHHRSRTKALFQDFVKSFDLADVLILCEIYDVAGRDEDKDKEVSSKQLVDAVAERNRIRGVENTVEFASDPAVSVARTFELVKENDVVIFMGAGDIDGAVRNAISTGTKRSEA
ncbi:MAG: cyanophycin synthetase, partial [Patescibacteria group bacterium]